MKNAAPLSLCLLFTATAAVADPGYYVVTPYSNEGLRTVDIRYWTVKPRNQPSTRWPEVGFGYGINSRWTTRLYASYIGMRDTATKLDGLYWENDWLLTQGQYPFDLAGHLTLTKNRDASEGYTVEAGPVVQTDVGRVQFNGNVFVERSYRASAAGPAQLKYQWQVKYRWRPGIQFGGQGFGEVGPWNHWLPRDSQSHRAGPAVFGSLPLGRGSLGYQAAFLLGSTYGQDGNMFSMRVYYAY